MKVGTGLIAAASLMTALASVDAAELERETLAAWDQYVAWTEHRIRTDLREDGRYLVQDSLPEALANEAREKLRAGEVFATKLETTADGRTIDVPKGLVHHWLGSVFIPGATVEELVGWLQDYDEHHRYFDEVDSSRLLSRDGDDFRIFLRLRRKKVVTVHYNTEHLVRYTHHRHGRMSSASYATRIAEIEDAGTASESEKVLGDDSGFLWRLNSYWRFEEAWGGVIVELESLSLSRGVPVAVRWLVGRYLDSVPRESLEATLQPIQREAKNVLVTDERNNGSKVVTGQ